jgi:hypothetical protein
MLLLIIPYLGDQVTLAEIMLTDSPWIITEITLANALPVI